MILSPKEQTVGAAGARPARATPARDSTVLFSTFAIS